VSRVLLWRVHGCGRARPSHDYLLALLPDGGPWGRGRCGRSWPDRVRELELDELAGAAFDVVLQRPAEAGLVSRWTDPRAGRA